MTNTCHWLNDSLSCSLEASCTEVKRHPSVVTSDDVGIPALLSVNRVLVISWIVIFTTKLGNKCM